MTKIVTRVCKICKKHFDIYYSKTQRGEGKFCSKSCMGKWKWLGERNPKYNSKRFGENNPNWKGGKKPKWSLRFCKKDWHQKRKEVLERDDYKCQLCGVSRKKMNVHHIIPYKEKPENCVNTLITLCNQCHPDVENGKKQVPFIGIALPTRGLVFADMIKSVFREASNFPHLWVLVSGKPIPEAQNEVIIKTLKIRQITHILMVEEDMVFPDDVLKQMVEMDRDIVCVDYPVAGGWSTIKKIGGEIQHCGLGCTLIKRKVFEDTPIPWFTTDKSINADTGEIMDVPMKYGGHDIFFFIKARQAGFKIHQLDGVECEHLRCSDLNRREYNDGTYTINSLPKISKWQTGVK